MKRSVYIVDDQENLLEMTVLVLRCLGCDWEVTGFNDPLAALEAIKTNAPDAVLTDQMMPGMEGSQLLEKVRVISPTTIRLIMSGYVALDKLSQITSAHQYIAKPYNPDKLRDLIQRSFAVQERFINQGLQSAVLSIRAVPSLPQVHHSLLAELEDNRSSGATIARLIGDDPGLSVKVLQLANSALFGQGQLITNPLEAVNCLGTDMITAIILSQSVFQRYESCQHGEIDLERVWSHCWETACIAQRLCHEKTLPYQSGEEAFLAGLLHEVGRFVLFDNFPDHFQIACDEARHSKTSLIACLRKTIQASPLQVSAYVLALWGLPDAVINSIVLLDNPEEDPAPGFSMTSALYIADHLASRTFPPDSFSLEDWKMNYLESIGCADEVPNWEELAMDPTGSTGR